MSRKDFEMPDALNNSMFADAKLYYDREDYLISKRFINNYLEIGVLAGDYSDMVLKHLNPVKADLVDLYNQPDWNQLGDLRFTADTHYEYVKNKYSNRSNVNVIQQPFHADIKEIDDQYDYIYIDASHTRVFMEGVLEFSKNHIVSGGIIGVNDYLIFDHFNDEYYGIVQATNKFLLDNPNFKIHAYVLGAALHPDIYLKRIS
jgi:hypothetical protein